MKTKQLVVLFSILVVLIVLAMWQRREVLFKPEPVVEQTQLLFAGFDPQAATRIELTKPDQQTVLSRQDDLWLVATASAVPAKAHLVTQLLDQVGQITKGDIVSQQPGKFALFQVDDSGLGVSITAEGEETLAHFYLGKPGPDFASLYLRKEGSNDVLLISGDLRPAFDQSDWRQKKVFSFEAQEVEELSLKYDDKRFSLIKEGDVWQLTHPEEAQAKKKEIGSILDALYSLRIIDYAEQQEPTEWELSRYGLDKPWFRIEASLVNGTALSLLAGNKNDEGTAYYAKRGAAEYIFTLPAHQVDRMKKKLTDLKTNE